MVARLTKNFAKVLVSLSMILMAPTLCHAITYATITNVTATQLRNAVQIKVEADGVLEMRQTRNYSESGSTPKSSQIKLTFPSARASVNSFIDISKYPVSHIQASVPQTAKDGIGVAMTINLFCASEYSISESADSQSVVITVKSERTLDSVDRGASNQTSDQKTEFTCTYQDGLMSIKALKTDMLKVFGEISKASDINLVVDDAVGKRTVSMSLDNMTPDNVLKSITSAYGLAMSKDKDIYMISEGVPTDLATYRLSGTTSFPMKNVQAQTASGLLPTFLYSYLHVNNEQNAVVVSSPTQMLEKIRKDLQKVDIAAPQIMVEAVAIEISGDNEAELSSALFAQGHNGIMSTDGNAGLVNYTTVGALPNEFNARLKALVAQNKAKIHSNPRMAVLNGQSADIFIGAQRFIRIQDTSYGQVTERIQGVDVGTRITVTPWTGGNGEITTTISPEVSNIVELERNTGLPTLSSRSASTTVRVKDGETIVIGGLTQKQEYNTRRKIPILGDIPFIGGAFRSTSKSSTNTELIILVTPRILTDSGHITDSLKEAAIKEKFLGEQTPAVAAVEPVAAAEPVAATESVAAAESVIPAKAGI